MTEHVYLGKEDKPITEEARQYRDWAMQTLADTYLMEHQLIVNARWFAAMRRSFDPSSRTFDRTLCSTAYVVDHAFAARSI